MPKTRSHKLAVEWFICHFRWGWLILAFFIAQVTATPALAENFTIVYILVGVGVIYNLSVLALLFIGWYPNRMITATGAIDTLLATALLWVTGGLTSALMPVLLFVVVTISLRINVETGLLSAVPMVLAYAVSLILSDEAKVAGLLDLMIKSVTLFMVAGITGYIGKKQFRMSSYEDKQEIKRLRQSTERAKAIYDMANTLSSTLNYKKVLKAMVDLAYMALSEVDIDNGANVSASDGIVGMVLLFDGDGPLGKLKVESGRNIPRSDEQKVIVANEGVLSQIIYKAEAVVVSNLQSDPILSQFVSLKQCNSMVCAPLRAGFDIFGLVMFASPKPGFYGPTHASLLLTFCNQAIIALQNAQLYEDLEMEQKKLLEKEAHARRELARNLHDGPTQAVASIAMRTNFVRMILQKEGNIEKSLEELEKVEAIANKTTQDIRTMLFTMRPVVLETQGLEAAITQYADRMRDLEGLNVGVELHGYEGQLSTEAEAAVFAIIEEAVNNSKKYGNADQTQIKLGVSNGNMILEVSDDGAGFDVEAVRSNYDQRGSLGLLNMEERSRLVGGRFKIHSAIGQGTKVRLEVPLERHARL